MKFLDFVKKNIIKIVLLVAIVFVLIVFILLSNSSLFAGFDYIQI